MSTDFNWTDEKVKEFVADLLRNGFYDIPKHILDFKEKKQPKPILFTAEDSVPIREGDMVWAVRKSDYYIANFKANFQSASLVIDPACNVWWYFSTEVAAQEFKNRFLQALTLSITDVMKWQGITEMHKEFFELLKLAQKNIDKP